MDNLRFPIIFKLLIPLILGVILEFYTGIYLGIEYLIGLVLSLFILSVPILSKQVKLRFLFGVMTSILFLFIGSYLAHINNSTNNEAYFGTGSNKKNDYIVQLVESPVEKTNTVKCVVEVGNVNGTQTVGKGFVYIEKDDASMSLQYGDILQFSSSFSPIRPNGNPHEFDYARYLRIHNIHEQAYIKSNNWVKSGEEGNYIVQKMIDLRAYFSSTLKQSGLSEKNFMVANALLLGQKEYLDKDVLRTYSSAGAMHVLAVSGLHVGIVMLILTFVFKPIKKIRKGKLIFLLLVLGGIWFYALITGMSPSVLRASVMFSFIIFGQELQRETTVYQSIMVSAFLLILLDPYIIFQVGFQLSYLAVLGIVFLQPKIVNLIYVENKILHKAWQISAVSIAAQIATFPLGIYYFHQFPNFFLVSNLLVIPLAFLILIVGISFLVIHLIPIISDLVFWVFDSLLTLLNLGVSWVEQLPYSIMWGLSIHWYEVFLLYLALLFGSIAFIYRKTYGLMIGLGITVILLVINLNEKYMVESSNELFVYNVNGEIAIDIFYGSDNTFISSADLYQDEEKLLFHVKHNWFFRSGNENPVEWKNIATNKSILFGDQKLLIVDESNYEIERNRYGDHDIILFHSITYIPSNDLDFLEAEKKQIIIGNNVGYGLSDFLYSNNSNALIHNLKRDGAFRTVF
jgi:competence protein ComEC